MESVSRSNEMKPLNERTTDDNSTNIKQVEKPKKSLWSRVNAFVSSRNLCLIILVVSTYAAYNSYSTNALIQGGNNPDNPDNPDKPDFGSFLADLVGEVGKAGITLINEQTSGFYDNVYVTVPNTSEYTTFTNCIENISDNSKIIQSNCTNAFNHTSTEKITHILDNFLHSNSDAQLPSFALMTQTLRYLYHNCTEIKKMSALWINCQLGSILKRV